MSTQNETTCSFVADPAVIYFPVSVPGYALRQSVRIVNSGKLSARMHVLPCSSPVFKVSMCSKKGFIAPGMHQMVEITCCPEDLEVTQEPILIHGEVCGLHGVLVRIPNSSRFGSPALTSKQVSRQAFHDPGYR